MPYDRILELMSPADAPNLFFLGTYAKRLTICSQQIRAINLIDAIQYYRCRLAGLRVAVVGGGIAGLTASARALEYGAVITIFEQNAGFVAIQNSANHRWIHPHIYDWPGDTAGAGVDDDAGLPVLNWSAQFADALAGTVLAGWDEVTRLHPNSVHSRLYAVVTGIHRLDHKYRVTWNDARDPAAVRSDDFDIVIVAVGFGLEREGRGRDSYWRPEGLAWAGRPGERRVLVAGYGDGALTDLMRVCLRDFNHERTLKQIIAALGRDDIDRIRAAEFESGGDDPQDLTDCYLADDFNFPNIRQFLADNLNPLYKVVLTGPGPWLFDPKASILNRFIVSQLLREDAFQHVPLPDDARIGAGDNADPMIASILSRTSRPTISDFTDFVLRFGTEVILPPDPARSLVAERNGRPIIDGLPPGLDGLRREWATITPAGDPTRGPLWNLVPPVWNRSLALRDAPPLPENIRRYCLTVQPSGPGHNGQWLPGVVGTAIGLLRLGRVLPPDFIPVTLSVEACVRSAEALASAARALCQAPIAVFNLGGGMGQQNPAGMVLLGIRAAVRRGLTLVIHDRTNEEPDWNALPFNLKELLVLPLTAADTDVDRLVSLITSGWVISRGGSGDYRDLPVFDVVRQFERRTSEVDRGRHEVFALCPFHDQYIKNDWPQLVNLIRGLGASDGRSFDVRPVTGYLSPMLVGDRIYELARFARNCIVDWTYWRANVFFELGVRLAVSEIPPICIIRVDEENSKLADAGLLRTLAPLRYDLQDEDSRVARKFNVDFQAESKPDIRGNRARLRGIFTAAQKNAALDQEFGHTPLEQELMREVRATVGPDVVRAAGFRILYRDNNALKQQTWRGLVDRLNAARLLLDFKIKVANAEGTSHDHLIRTRGEVVVLLRDLLARRFDQDYDKYAEMIQDEP